MSRFLYGRKVFETLILFKKPVLDIFLQEPMEPAWKKKIESLAGPQKIPLRAMAKHELTRVCGTELHQGIVFKVPDFQYVPEESLILPGEGLSILLVLDGVESPQNLGAIIRTALFFNISGLFIPQDRSCEITPTVTKVSIGASEVLPVARVTNVARFLTEIKQSGYWVYGTTVTGESIHSVQFPAKTVLVMGNEETGLRENTLKKCDYQIQIPHQNRFDTLNVSASTAIALYEVRRQV